MSNIANFSNSDELMKAARAKALRTFKYFWRESSWEARRIIPGLEVAVVKIGIKTDSNDPSCPEMEHMWFSDVYFDGVILSATLSNQPQWVSTLNEGDRYQGKLADISDWIYAIDGKVYGGFTVHVLRNQMSPSEQKKHDAAWGMDFGDSKNIRIVPVDKSRNKGNSKSYYVDGDDIPEHPMSLNMKEKCEEGLRENPEPFIAQNEEGSSMLHFDALGGNLTQVELLLKYGADKNMTDANGMKPIDLAAAMKWDKVVAALSR